MKPLNELVLLLGVDNTLVDSDPIATDLRAMLGCLHRMDEHLRTAPS